MAVSWLSEPTLTKNFVPYASISSSVGSSLLICIHEDRTSLNLRSQGLCGSSGLEPSRSIPGAGQLSFRPLRRN